ncbi:hypothetical protein PMAYCL1PPCAC_14479, partial [Pristionchus mayeri]
KRHLFKKHHTTPYRCNIANFTVIRKRDGPIQTFDDAKTTPRCIMCDVYPKSARGYAVHLRQQHHKTFIESGIMTLL